MMSSHTMTRRQFVAAGAAVAAVGSVAACGSGASTSGGKAQILTLQDPGLSSVEQNAANQFNQGSSVKMELTFIPQTTNMDDKIRTLMPTANRPDMFFNWAGSSIRPYADAGLLVDFTPKFKASPAWQSSFVAPVLNAGQINGKYYAIPLKGMQPVVLYYNKSIFRKYGVQPPRTWNDLLSLIGTFKNHGVTPIVLAGATSWTELMYMEYLLDRVGGPGVFQNIAAGKAGAWRDPAVMKSLQLIVSLVDMGAFGQKYSSVNYLNGSATALFGQGGGAMTVMGTWEFTGQVAANPQFARQDLGFTSFPLIPGGKGDPRNLVGNPTNYFSVTSQSRYADACVSFLRKEMTSRTYVDGLIKAGDIPAVTGISARLQQLAPNPAFATAVYSMAQKAPSFTLSWDQNLSQAEGQNVITYLQEVFNKQMSPQQFVTTMDKG